MKHNREFEIAWQGLKLGTHTFQYEIDNRFMVEHGESETDLKNIEAKVTLTFDKKSNFFLLHFDIDGKITAACDRCGDDFEMGLWDEFDLVMKLAGEDVEEIDDEADVAFIPRSETVIDISKWIYEFVMLSVPLQRIHSDTADGKPGCNPEALRLLEELSEPEGEEKPKNDIWKGLETLKENSNNNKKRKS
ncbi:YceD family protein [Chitinophagaceae bacterium MMS25-I14]